MMANIVRSMAGGAILALGLAACSPGAEQPEPQPSEAMAEPVAPAPVNSAAVAENRFDAWAGRWIGVGGMFADITPNGDGSFTIEMQSDLETRGTYRGQAVADGIEFERGGEQFVLRAGNGEQTGLKWLADKTDCLVVAEGEGYCRD